MTKMMGGKGKVLEAKVVSLNTPKTAVVTVVTSHRHPIYKKATKRTQRYLVHNEMDTITVGDSVQIRETKPISKSKHFIIIGKIK